MKVEVLESQSGSPDEETRTVWIRCHPAISMTVLSTLKGAVSLTLDTLKRSPGHSENSHSVEILDLRESINVFEITGPKSSQVVHGALTPAITNHNGEFKKVRYIELSRLMAASSFIPSFGRLWLASKVRVLSQATWSLALPL
jgi:ribonuclease P/MRP protein subunit POP1